MPHLRPLSLLVLIAAFAQAPQPFKADPPMVCDACDEWNKPRQPFKIYGNSYYVGAGGVSAVLVTSPGGHILLDGGLLAHTRALRESSRS